MQEGQPDDRPTGLTARAIELLTSLQCGRTRMALVAALMFVVQIGAAEAAGVTPGYAIQFPRDAGSHPEFDTEWWYVTGWLKDEAGVERGFQVTFFRSRNESAQANPSNFAPKQLLFAHAAVSDPAQRKLLHAQRAARAGFGLAEADTADTNVHIEDWDLRARASTFVTHVTADDFAFALQLTQTQPPLLQGENGFSQKGPNPIAASYYYSLPNLQVSGTLRIGDDEHTVTGSAWFDHEWFNSYVSPDAVGWDWIGINLDDGGSLMVFRIRDAKHEQYWAGATLRDARGRRHFAPNDVDWQPIRRWRSPRTNVEYPVEWRVDVGDRTFMIRPLFDDQENDARDTVGVLYWEGAVRVFDIDGRAVGKGYLELTGYDARLEM